MLTVKEAEDSLGEWLDRALTGEQIRIRKGHAVVELRPAPPDQLAEAKPLAHREALRRMQEDARLKPELAEQYLREVREERLAAETQRTA